MNEYNVNLPKLGGGKETYSTSSRNRERHVTTHNQQNMKKSYRAMRPEPINISQEIECGSNIPFRMDSQDNFNFKTSQTNSNTKFSGGLQQSEPENLNFLTLFP